MKRLVQQQESPQGGAASINSVNASGNYGEDDWSESDQRSSNLIQISDEESDCL